MKPRIKRRRVPLLIQRLPWLIFGILIGMAIFHFVPVLSDNLQSLWPVESRTQLEQRYEDENNLGIAYMLAGTPIFPEIIKLRVIRKWFGDDSRSINFKSDTPPYVINVVRTEVTSKIASRLTAQVYKKGDVFKIGDMPITSRKMPEISAFVIGQKGDFVIELEATGCNWEVFVGKE